MSRSTEQLEAVKNSTGFIAALDQSGGSTPKALSLYGVDAIQYSSEQEMFEKVHEMRTRIMTNQHFTRDSIMAAILFENTMDRTVLGKPTTRYLWEDKGIVPILKIDKGLADVENDVQVMKPMPDLDALLDKALDNGVFGTKMRSVIKSNNQRGIENVVAQQFEIGNLILGKGLVPIIEPEVDIHSPDKHAAEDTLRSLLLSHLDSLPEGRQVIFKLTLPETANFYMKCIDHPNILKVVALSGGYSREEANRRLSENLGMQASFSRALTEGLSVAQDDAEFSQVIRQSIDSIVTASRT
ncbi:MAG: fructose bisphosphate aldolase [Gammaproteobacteria bacterium]|nr:fructose bisphosphate aldolase [Gammaproteobacteria bacterium]MCY4312986.1 fructose bisphosphate aldolase [Gammaproteobacteria bacterium]